MIEFDWDEEKRRKTLEERGIDFADAVRIFFGPAVRIRSDRKGELRWKLIGMLREMEVVVIYTVRGRVHRIISARRANTDEREFYRRVMSGG
ncbi:MAG TPA: BrnT family toxin [Longimicrobiaceae bacterium]|nr:BrnT family toxin [Longimicrobiaceae bacterium]